MAAEVIDQFRDASNQQLVNAGDSTNTAVRVNIVAGGGGGSGTSTVVQGTASNLNATVVGTVSAVQSGAWSVSVTGTATTLNAKSTTVSAPAQATIGTTAGTALASNASRLNYFIQNTGITVLKFTYGTTNPTATAYHFALQPGTATDDAKGWSVSDDIWRGQINVISAATGGQYVVAELT
jgi:hypothetical protein